MSSNFVSLAAAPSEGLKNQIISCFWRRTKEDTNIEDYSSYFQFYHKICEGLYLGLHSEVKSLVAENHHHVLIIVEVLWEYLDLKQPCKRPELRRKLEERFDQLDKHGPDSQIRLNNSINLALRLWLTMDIQDSVFAPATTTIQWDDSSTLHDFVKSQFPGPKGSSIFPKDETAIPIGDLTAVKLQRIGGITIEWTYLLNQHLKYDRESRRLKIYTLKTCLHDQQSWCVCLCRIFKTNEADLNILSQAAIIPNAVVCETILSLRLLFPDWDPQSSRLLRHIDKPRFEGGYDHRSLVYLSDFHFWRDRLSELYLEYELPPVSWRQIWTDRRNKLQWYTFWLAFAILILTIAFGLISSVTACLQTKYAYEALQLARAAAAQTTQST